MSVFQYTFSKFLLSSGYDGLFKSLNVAQPPLDLLRPIRQWLDCVEISCPNSAHRLCHLIPAQCPFSRTLRWGDRTFLTIPPLCKLNPLYEELMALRFRALCYLAEECGEDISRYC